MRQIRLCIFLLLGAVLPLAAAPVAFYRFGERVDRFLLQGLDTSYIGLPEHSWRLALNNSEVGVNSKYTTWVDPETPVTLVSNTTPSIGLGFNAGYRGFGFGYSWDVMNAYSVNWNVSLGSKSVGLEFMRNVSTNLKGSFVVGDITDPTIPKLEKGELKISNTSLTAWYALNSAHYSHNAAIKQSFIQKRTAGSLLLSVAYRSSEVEKPDSLKWEYDEYTNTLVDGVVGIITRQLAVGLGYGINYTPNKGKVILHLAANMEVVCYSVNHVSYVLAAAANLPGEPQFVLTPAKPVHVTGNMRAAVSWEINEWVHLSAWAQARHIGFSSNKAGGLTVLDVNNWNWQAHLSLGVRFGAGKKRVRKALDESAGLAQAEAPVLAADTISATTDTIPTVTAQPVKADPLERPAKLPRWLTDFFFSPRL